MYDVPREQEPPLQGMRPERLPGALGPQEGLERAVCPCSRVPRLTPVVVQQDAAHDDKTVAWLLERSLAERQRRELVEVRRLEEVVVTRMQRLEAEVMQYAGRDRSRVSDLEKAAVTLVVHSDALNERRKRRMKRSKKKLPKAPLPRCGRPCALQRQVPAVGSALRSSSSTTCGHSCCGTTTGASFDGAENRGSAVAFYRRSSTSLSFRRGRSSWSRLFSRPQRFLCCCTFSGGPCPCCASRACPLLCNDRCVVRQCRKPRWCRSCRSSLVVDIPVMVQRPIPMFKKKVTFPLKNDAPQIGLLVFSGKETHSETKSWK